MVPEEPARCSIVVDSHPSALEVFCRPLLEALQRHAYTEDDIFGIHLAVEEAFYNAVVHGNGRDPAKKVQVDYTVARERVEIRISDEGDGFDPADVPDPREGDNLYRPNGRGLLLIQAYMDEVRYNDRGNCVTLVRRRQRHDTTAT